MSQRRRYALLGLFLAVGAPLGLMGVLLAEAPAAVSLARVEALLRSSPAVWAYVWGATSAVMCAAGAWAGAQEDRWRALSTRDALTGLPNRRAFDDALAGALDNVRRQDARYALLAIDVDHLKRINDAGGHAAGDAAIRAVAEVLRRECRASDLPARVGGDELMVLAAGVEVSGGVALAERVRARSRELGGPTLSVGVTALTRDDDARTVTRRADEALYEAKARGRDQVAASR
ncbi:GGDEF domain-containing protein [Myxococcota bacterium]|nr:GGDEF domain-containing protein [Myxococcota bacterium]